MATSSFIRVGTFKSSLREVAGCLLRSRETQANRAKQRTQKIQCLRKENARVEKELQRLQQELAKSKREIARLKTENTKLCNDSINLPDDPSLHHHSYGPKIISLCVNLACEIGLRPASTALQTIFDWLNVEAKVPNWTTIRTWLCRAGVAAIEEPIEPADDWIWMADHSNQIGPEKVLLILGIRASKLPEPGQAIRHKDMRTLAVIPGVQWKREDMAREYTALANRIGAPMALVVDGAVELREGIEPLQTQGKKVVVLLDFKHHAANVLRKVIGQEERFAEFLSQLGRTRSAIQQTELAHFTPPAQKPKARFMNLASTLCWAEMTLWQLGHPHSNGRREIKAQRMNEKLGWLREFRADTKRWNNCQAVVSRAVTFINEQGLSVGSADQLEKTIANLAKDETSRKVANQLVAFVRDSESQLASLKSRSGNPPRLPMSTEILESTFGLYKRLERQHSKSGFTSLLPSIGVLLKRSTPEQITRAFAQIFTKQMRKWIADNLGSTLASKRNAAYKEHTKATIHLQT